MKQMPGPILTPLLKANPRKDNSGTLRELPQKPAALPFSFDEQGTQKTSIAPSIIRNCAERYVGITGQCAFF